MKKTWVIVIILLLGVAYFFIETWLHDPFTSKARVQTKTDNMEYIDHPDVVNKMQVDLEGDITLEREVSQVESDFQMAVKESRTIQTLNTLDGQSKEPVITPATVSPWNVIDKANITEDIRLRDGIEPVQILQINSNVLGSVSEGDHFNFPIINNKQYDVVVSKKKTLWNGDISIQGKLQGDDGDTFPVIISSGKNTTFASFSTSEGSFELEAFGNVGGLYSVNEMDKQAFYPGTDELLH